MHKKIKPIKEMQIFMMLDSCIPLNFSITFLLNNNNRINKIGIRKIIANIKIANKLLSVIFLLSGIFFSSLVW